MGLDGDIFVYFIKEDFFMRTLKITRKITAVMAAVLVAFSICTFAPSNVHAAETLDANVSAQPFKAGGYASTWNPVSGQGNFTLNPDGYSSNAKLTIEANNSTTSTVYVAVTSKKDGRTIWAGFLPTSMKQTKWFGMKKKSDNCQTDGSCERMLH